PAVAVLALPLVTGFLEPYGRAFEAGAVAAAAGRRVLAPDRFAQDQELLRFRLPGARLAGYACPHGPTACAPPPPGGDLALAYLDPGQPAPQGWAEVAEVPVLKMRHSPEQVARLAGGDLTLLVERLALLRPSP
ncbi:MAG TPA: hypothetical protein VFP50_16765, partial [Anaeromyxobacteraceae bacterium]|nr:hypothetical protein [Anaeromyxobacteraceae bacterium]